MYDWKSFRSQFPALESQTWVNAAGTSPLPLPVYERGRRFLEEVMLQGDRGFARWHEEIERTRGLVAGVFGFAPEEIAFTQGTSHSMNLVAGLLRSMGATTIVTLGSEFPSSTLPFLHQGFDVRFVEPEGAAFSLERIAAALVPGVHALVASHVQFGTGWASDLHALGALCRERGVRFVVNATQSFGARPVPAGSAGADFVAATSHKWACAGYGCGLLAVRREILAAHRFPFAGWTSVEQPFDMDNRRLSLKSTAAAAEVGTFAFDTAIRLGAALDVLMDPGFERIHERIVELTDRLRAGLRELGLEPITPDDRASRSGITCVKVADPAAAATSLAARQIFSSPRRGTLRIALHAYNDEADVDRTLEALRSI